MTIRKIPAGRNFLAPGRARTFLMRAEPGQGRAIGWGSLLCQAKSGSGLEPLVPTRHDRAMSSPPHAQSREERLAAKLRENLRRRKAQARALEAGSPEADANPALPKPPLKS